MVGLRRIVAVSAVTSVILSACNVLLSVGLCESDSDCASSQRCDLSARICVNTAPTEDVQLVDVSSEASSDAGSDVSDGDAADSYVPPCDLLAPFGDLKPVPGLEEQSVYSIWLSPDETLLLYSALPNGCFEELCVDIFKATRLTTDLPFSGGHLVDGLSTPVASEYFPSITSDGLLVFFESSRSLQKLSDGGYVKDQARIWQASRVNKNDVFHEPTNQLLFAIDTTKGSEGMPYLHPSGTAIYFTSSARDSGTSRTFDLFRATLDGLGTASRIEELVDLNTSAAEGMPITTLDDQTIYFARERPDNTREIYQAKRPSPAVLFTSPTKVTELNSEHDNFPSWISDDECRFYFISSRPLPSGPTPEAGSTERHAWVASRPALKP